MRTVAWVVAAAALLAPGSPPCAAEGGKKPPPKAPPAAKPAEPLPDHKDAMAALRRHAFAEAERLADAALAGKPVFEERLALLIVSAQAKLLNQSYVGCLHRAEQLRKAFEAAPIPEPDRAMLLRPVREIRAEVLLALGREDDARKALETIRASKPDPGDLDRTPYLEAVLRSSGSVTFDMEYEGRDRRHPGLAEMKKRAVESFPKAVHRIRFWLEAPDLVFPPLVMRFGDDDWNGDRDSSAAAWATPVIRGGTVVGVVTLGVAAILGGQLEGNGLLAHELGHTLRAGGTQGRLGAVWLEEGIAHWISGDIDLELPNYALAWRVCPAHFAAGGGWPEYPLRSIPETEAGVAALGEDSQRLCGALFFEHVERTGGLKRMRKLMRALLAAEDASAVIRAETGKSTDEIFAEVSRGLSAWERRAWYEFEELEVIRWSLHGKSWADAEGRCRKFIAEHPATSLLPVAKRGLFLALHEQGRAAEARQVLNDAILEHRGSWVHPWLLLEDLRLSRAAGNPARVLELAGWIQSGRTCLDSPARDEVIAAMKEARGALGGGGGDEDDGDDE